MPAGRDRVALAAFLTASVLTGGNAVAVRFSNRELDPLWGAGLRFTLAAAILLGVMAAWRLPFPRGRALGGAVIYGLINFGFTFALIYTALVHLHAGLGQTIVALVPLVTLLLAVAQRQERLHASTVLGTLLALAGVAIVSGASLGEGVTFVAIASLLGAVLGFSEASVLVRRLPPVHPVTLNAVGMTAGAAALLLASLIAGESWAAPHRAVTWLALAYVVVLGSAVVYVLYVVVLKYWPASRVAYLFVITPFFAVLLSAWLDDEPIRATVIFGALLILAGVYVGALRPVLRPEATPVPTDPA